MSQALYRKYRSKSLDEVVGQSHITTTLKNALAAGHISHAYLFTGPRGVGKTSIARILAHEINKLPYDETMNYLDIIEIDAASNRGIEEIRDLREKAALAPTGAPYKIYIIDEVHMLTAPAFNALLKTLEEPPAHVIFMLATTEAHKLPETIISRTQRHSLKPIEIHDMVPHLQRIAEAEAINIDQAALELIARHADGGFRDAISLLDHVRRGENIVTADDVAEIIGLPPQEQISELIDLIIAGNANAALVKISQLFEHGYHPQKIVEELLLQAREQLLQGSNTAAQERFLLLMEGIMHSTHSANPKIALELAVYKSAYASNHLPPQPSPNQLPNQPENKPKESKQAPSKLSGRQKAASSTPTTAKVTSTANVRSNQPDRPVAEFSWDEVLQQLKGNHNTLYGILRMAETSIQSEKRTITLGFQFPFHMKRAAEGKHAHTIQETIKNICGQDYEIRYEKRTMSTVKRSEDDDLEVETNVSTPRDALSTVRSVFGDAEVVR